MWLLPRESCSGLFGRNHIPWYSDAALDASMNTEANGRYTLTVVLVGDGYDGIRAVFLRDGRHVFKPRERDLQLSKFVHCLGVLPDLETRSAPRLTLSLTRENSTV